MLSGSWLLVDFHITASNASATITHKKYKKIIINQTSELKMNILVNFSSDLIYFNICRRFVPKLRWKSIVLWYSINSSFFKAAFEDELKDLNKRFLICSWSLKASLKNSPTVIKKMVPDKSYAGQRHPRLLMEKNSQLNLNCLFPAWAVEVNLSVILSSKLFVFLMIVLFSSDFLLISIHII